MLEIGGGLIDFRGHEQPFPQHGVRGPEHPVRSGPVRRRFAERTDRIGIGDDGVVLVLGVPAAGDGKPFRYDVEPGPETNGVGGPILGEGVRFRGQVIGGGIPDEALGPGQVTDSAFHLPPPA
jgi:hypothetical protein